VVASGEETGSQNCPCLCVRHQRLAIRSGLEDGEEAVKSSEAAAAIAARNGAPPVVTEIPLGTRLSDANAKKVIANITDYRTTRIVQTEGGAESESRCYGKDSVLDTFHRRKNMHKLLSQMCCDANMSEQEARPMREALDRHLDEQGDPEDEEEEEELEDAEPEELTRMLHDALDRMIAGDRKRKGVVAQDNRSTAMDARKFPMSKICHCCGNLGGVKEFQKMEREHAARRAHLI
jgi:hypothetical protein